MDKQSAKELIRKYVSETNIIKTNKGLIELNKNYIGEGGTAIVYASTDDKYAIKFLAEDISNNETQAYKRFKQEFTNLSKLSEIEKNIIEFYDFDSITIKTESNGDIKIPFILMKKYKQTLKDKFKTDSINNVNDLDDITNSLLSAIERLHINSIIHRDLKPENIFFDVNDNLIIGDFGISWFDDKKHIKIVKTSKGDRLANFNFSAPEQFEKQHNPEPTLDLFAIGQILYWLVTKKTIKGTGYKKLHSYLGEKAYLYDIIIEKLIQEDPNNRPNSIQSLKNIIIDERKNLRHNWLINENKYYKNLSISINDWKENNILPSHEMLGIIIENLDLLLLTNQELIFLILAYSYKVKENDYVYNDHFIRDLNWEELINFDNDEIFEPFEISFNRMYGFDFNHIDLESIKTNTDCFDLYFYGSNKKEIFKCIYCELNIKKTNDKYKILIINNIDHTIRICKVI